MSNQYQIAFWNLENLFDIENSPRRSDKLQRAIENDLQGWTQAQLNNKISQLASIIKQMNDGNGPDIFGVCEVENEYVISKLVQALTPLGRNYGIVHHDMSDKRGIDVGFIYDEDLFSVENKFYHVVMRRTATRDILQVNFRTQNNRLLVIIGNHWPSRSGGALKSAVYRAIAGETLAYFHQRILEVHGPDTPILVMGDFNDEPFNSSITDYALSIRSHTKVLNARKPCLFNLMWPLMGQGSGTFYFNNFPNLLDQFHANKNMLKQNSLIKALPNTVEIFSIPVMIGTGKYKTPIRFGGMGKTINTNGYSDHFPITITIEEE